MGRSAASPAMGVAEEHKIVISAPMRNRPKARCSTASGLCFVLIVNTLAIQKNRGAADVPFQPVR